MAPHASRLGLSPTFSATNPLRRLKTVFSSGNDDSQSSHSANSTSTTSPLSRSASPSASEDDFSPLSFTSYSDSSRSSSHSHSASKRPFARKPSILDLEMMEERRSFGHELEMLEPRPIGQGVGLGIFEVLDGRV